LIDERLGGFRRRAIIPNAIDPRRALGATAPDVFFQFVLEAFVLAAIGVVAGSGSDASRRS
jgi:hypothetical protein